MQPDSTRPSYAHAPSLFWPIILIGVGTLLLLSNLGLIAADAWSLIWQLWPVLLIVIGIDVLLGRRGIWSAVASIVLGLSVIAAVVALLLAATYYPTWFDSRWSINNSSIVSSEPIALPLAAARSADVHVEIGSGTASIYAVEDSANLIQGDVTHTGTLQNSVERVGDRAVVRLGTTGGVWNALRYGTKEQWKLGFNSGVTYNARLDIGSGNAQLDLAKLTLEALSIDVGSGTISLALPGGKHRTDLEIGSGSASVKLPEDAAVRIEYRVGSGSVTASGLRQVRQDRHSGVYETTGGSASAPTIVVVLDVGSGSATIR